MAIPNGLRARLDKLVIASKPLEWPQFGWIGSGAEIEIPYLARDVFSGLHGRTERWAVVVAHRRAGKTVACVNELIMACCNDTSGSGRYGYIAPYYSQAKAVAWDYVKQFTRNIPGCSVFESELKVDFLNGSRLRLFGADNADRLRGLYFNTVVCDEFADFRPSVWPYVIRPTLSDRNGKAIIIGTPKGKNTFYDRFVYAEQDDGWYCTKIKASESGILSGTELAELRRDLGVLAYDQEMECDFEIPIQGAYYAEALREARREDRVTKMGADPLMTRRAFFDIGGTGARSDSCAIWVAQVIGKEIRVLDYYEAQGQPLSTHVQWLRDNGHGSVQCILPHDGIQHDKVYQVTYESALMDAGFDVMTIKNQGTGAAMQRVEALRRVFPSIWFKDCQSVNDGLATLEMYHENRDEIRNIGLGPCHDRASHCADALGLMAVALPSLVDVTSWNRPIDYSTINKTIY